MSLVTRNLIFLFFILNSYLAVASELEDIKKRIFEEDKKIKIFEDQLAQGGETQLLADLLFGLSESYQHKAVLMYNKKKLENPNAPDSELDFSIENREKEKSIGILEQVVKIFKKTIGVTDRALYFSALTKKSLGKVKGALVDLKKIVDSFKGSEYEAKAYLEIGDFYSLKNDHKFAVKFYKKGIQVKNNPTYYKLQNKIGWSYYHLGKQVAAYRTFYTSLKKLRKEKDINVYKQDTEELLKGLAYSYCDLLPKEFKFLKSKKIIPPKISIDVILSRLSPNERAFSKSAKIVTQRLLVKKRHVESTLSGAKWLNTEYNIKDRIEAIYKTFESWKLSGQKIYLKSFVKNIVSTFQFFREEDFRSKDQRKKTEIDMEVIVRTYLTQMDKIYRRKGNKKVIANLISGYRLFRESFQFSKKLKEININLAELLFLQKEYIEAGQIYYHISKYKSDKKQRLEMLSASVKSFILSLKKNEKGIKDQIRLRKLEARSGLRQVGSLYLKFSPKGPVAQTIAFNYAQSFYRERDFKKASKSFWNFLKTYPQAPQNSQSALLLLDCFDQMNQKKHLVSVGKKLIAGNMIKNPQVRSQVQEIIEETVISGSRSGVLGRNNNLLKIAMKNKGTSLGDKALYEAFVDLKAKRNPKAYQVGETILSQHGDSKFAKTVVSDMAKMAIITADLKRAARYFSIFSKNYPSDKDSKKFLKSASEIYRNLHDFKTAKEIFIRLKNFDKAAEMDMLQGQWTSLRSSCRKTSSQSRGFYCGVASYFLGDFLKSQKFLVSASRSSDKERSAGAIYFLSLIKLKKYEALKMQAGREVEIIAEKQRSLVELQNLTTQLAQTGDSKWGLAGQFLMGRTYANFSQFILSTPLPSRMPASTKNQLKTQLQQQAKPYFKSSLKFFNSCRKNAEKMKIFNGAALGCTGHKSRFSEEQLMTLNSGGHSKKDSPKVQKIRSQLYAKPRDVKLYIQLAVVLIKKKLNGQAASVLNRAYEIDPKNAKVLSLLGVAQTRLGDEQSAFDNFSKSLRLNAKEPDAIVGQYYLFKKFKYIKSLKKISKLYKTYNGKARIGINFYTF